MSTPGKLETSISKGAKWSFSYLLRVKATGDPVDLTGSGPFVCEVRALNKDQLLATATVTSDYDATGIFTVTLTAAQTANLPLGNVRMGVRDANDNPIIEGTPEVVWFTPHTT